VTGGAVAVVAVVLLLLLIEFVLVELVDGSPGRGGVGGEEDGEPMISSLITFPSIDDLLPCCKIKRDFMTTWIRVRPHLGF